MGFPFGAGCHHRFCKDCNAGFDKHNTEACPLCRASRFMSPERMLYASPRQVTRPNETHRPGWIVSLTSHMSPRNLVSHNAPWNNHNTLEEDLRECIPTTRCGWVQCVVFCSMFLLIGIAALNTHWGRGPLGADAGRHIPMVHPQLPGQTEEQHMPGENGGSTGLHHASEYHHDPLPAHHSKPHIFHQFH